MNNDIKFGGLYRLGANHEPVRVDDLIEWAQWFERSDRERRVKLTRKFGGHVVVSTVFLGLAHWGGTLFETMVFGGRHSRWQWRYRTWDDAVRGHKSAVRRAGG